MTGGDAGGELGTGWRFHIDVGPAVVEGKGRALFGQRSRATSVEVWCFVGGCEGRFADMHAIDNEEWDEMGQRSKGRGSLQGDGRHWAWRGLGRDSGLGG